MKTFIPKPNQISHNWHLLDANEIILGRLSTKIARLLTGKNKTYFTPNLDCGDYVVVINAAKIKTTGSKLTSKFYYRHSNYPGGFKSESLKDLLRRDATQVIRIAVTNMLPKNKLQSRFMSRLKIYKDDTHPYQDKLIPTETKSKE